MAGRRGEARVYYEKSCPKCGLPGNDGRGSMKNKQLSAQSSKKARCSICNTLLKGKDYGPES